jgi:hypothetical protein
MSKNFSSFVCYPTNKENFQNASNPLLNMIPGAQSINRTPARVVTTVRATPPAGLTTVRATPPAITTRPLTTGQTPPPSVMLNNDWFLNSLNELDNYNTMGRNQVTMSDYEYKYLNLSSTDKMAFKNYIRNPFTPSTSDEDKISRLNGLSNLVKDALFSVPSYLISFDPRTRSEASNFNTAYVRLSPEHRNILNTYMNTAPYERSTMYGNLPAPVKSIADSNYVLITLIINDNQKNYGKKIYFPANISLTSGTSIDKITGGNLCVDDVCVDADNIKDLMKSLITLVKQNGQYYKTNN